MKFNGYTLVWGKEFIFRFLDLSAPTWLAEGNLPYFVSHFDYEHVIFTVSSDWESIQNSETYERMSALFPIRPVFIDDIRLGFASIKEKYGVLSSVQVEIIKDFHSSGAEGFFDIYPDTVWSENLCVSIVKQLNLGKRIYFTKPIRVWEDGVLQHLDQPLTPRHLVEISIFNLHPDWSYYEIDSGHHGNDEKCIWRVEDKGLVLKSFQPSPMVFVPDSRENLDNMIATDGMIDSNLHVAACPDKSTYYYQEDSDEGVVIEPIEFTKIQKSWKSGTKADNMAMFLRAALANPRSHNQISRLDRTFRFHFEDFDESWKPVEEEADRFIAEVTEKI